MTDFAQSWDMLPVVMGKPCGLPHVGSLSCPGSRRNPTREREGPSGPCGPKNQMPLRAFYRNTLMQSSAFRTIF